MTNCCKKLKNIIFGTDNYDQYNSIEIIEISDKSYKKEICSMCFRIISEEDKDSILLSCNHKIHLNCINYWLNNNSECMVCYKKLNSNIQKIRNL